MEDIDTGKNLWKGIFIADETAPQQPRIYLAKTGRLFSNGGLGTLQLSLNEGIIYSSPADKVGSDSVTQFGSLEIPLRELNITSPDKIPKKNQEKTMGELYAEIHSGAHQPGSRGVAVYVWDTLRNCPQSS